MKFSDLDLQSLTLVKSFLTQKIDDSAVTSSILEMVEFCKMNNKLDEMKHEMKQEINKIYDRLEILELKSY